MTFEVLVLLVMWVVWLRELEPLLSSLHLNDTFRRSDIADVENAIKAKLGERWLR